MNASREHRAAMLRLAIAPNVAFALDESDLADDASGYTADLLPRLRERYPGAEMSFIVGGDSLVRSRWQRLDEVVDMVASIVVAPRGDVTEDDLDRALDGMRPDRRAKIRLLDDLPLAGESATLIRARLHASATVRYLVPEPVHRYIAEHGLYRA